MSVGRRCFLMCKGAVDMNSSLALALCEKSLPAPLSAVSYESKFALASNAPESDELQHSDVRLSARERTILLLMGHGLSYKRIARPLSITPETVESHAKRIFWKLTVQRQSAVPIGGSDAQGDHWHRTDGYVHGACHYRVSLALRRSLKRRTRAGATAGTSR
jgi:DNA-binding CsgD family transcriptional regulator